MSERILQYAAATCLTCHKSSGESNTSLESTWVWAKDHLKQYPRHRIGIVLDTKIEQVNDKDKSAWGVTVARFRQQAGLKQS